MEKYLIAENDEIQLILEGNNLILVNNSENIILKDNVDNKVVKDMYSSLLDGDSYNNHSFEGGKTFSIKFYDKLIWLFYYDNGSKENELHFNEEQLIKTFKSILDE